MPDGEIDDPDSFYQQLDSSEPNTARLTNPLNKRLASMVEYERARDSCAVKHNVTESTHYARSRCCLTGRRLPICVHMHVRQRRVACVRAVEDNVAVH